MILCPAYIPTDLPFRLRHPVKIHHLEDLLIYSLRHPSRYASTWRISRDRSAASPSRPSSPERDASLGSGISDDTCPLCSTKVVAGFPYLCRDDRDFVKLLFQPGQRGIYQRDLACSLVPVKRIFQRLYPHLLVDLSRRAAVTFSPSRFT